MRIVRLASAIVAVGLLLATTAAEAALTTDKCLVSKRKAWITFRKCQGAEETKQLRGKPADLAKCTTKLQEALGKADVKANKAGIACRYRDNGDRTVTDFDTGLMWEKKSDDVIECFLGVLSCVELAVTWHDATGGFVSFLNGIVASFTDSPSGLAGHSDWRLPTIKELRAIFDSLQPTCDTGSLCIDPIFGPTMGDEYWSSTTYGIDRALAFYQDFDEDLAGATDKTAANFVRAVRNAL